MLATTRARTFESVISSTSSVSIPTFLLPAFATISRRTFQSSASCQSHIGSAPLSIPPEVKLVIRDPPKQKAGRRPDDNAKRIVEIEGPLGKLSYAMPLFVTLNYDVAGGKATVSIQDREEKIQKAMWGTVRACLNNHILGVSEGHTAILRLVGVGYRATIESNPTTKTPAFAGQQFVSLKVGYSHPIEMPIPYGMKASTPQPTRILLEGNDKRDVMQFAAEIREWRRPEPYKGKGIFVNGETIKLKAKKIK